MMEALSLAGLGHNTLIVLAGATALGVAAGMVGCFMVLRRRALLSDALSHATLPGIVIAFMAATALGLEGRSLPLLLLGAAASGVLSVLCVQAISRWTRLTEDVAIGAVLSVFFGLGVVLLSVVQEMPGANAAGLKGFILGQTAAMHAGEAASLGGLALLAALAVTLLYKEFTLLSFDPGFARAAGWPAGRFDLALMALVTLVTVVGLQTVGLVLIIALLITPAAAARFWTDRLPVMLAVAALIGGVSGGVGALLSARFHDIPAGAVIVLVASALFTFSLLLAPGRGLLARSLRRNRLREDLIAGRGAA
ncbi:metal ABC transporter permease [Niveispirillum irakense]|uniref:metal ABC transporter permease n=1 Tax=Niveispirillum irakense TaxID=34011 RepID=UPI0004213127|nr:metal ABC transporter permease [Niveispirillum irakense]